MVITTKPGNPPTMSSQAPNRGTTFALSVPMPNSVQPTPNRATATAVSDQYDVAGGALPATGGVAPLGIAVAGLLIAGGLASLGVLVRKLI
jgi:hypothetical protein